jgi:hypothetical protein
MVAIALLAVTSAAADTPSTDEASNEAALVQSQQELQQAQQEMTKAQQELVQAQSLFSADMLTTASNPDAETRAKVEEALKAAGVAGQVDLTDALAKAQSAYALAGSQLALAGDQLDKLRAELDALQASGDLSAAGSEKLVKLLDELQAQHQAGAYVLPDAESFYVPGSQGLSGTAQVYRWQGYPGTLWSGEALNEGSLKALEERLESLKVDTQALEEQLKKVEELKESGKLDELKGLSSMNGEPMIKLWQRGSGKDGELFTFKELELKDLPHWQGSAFTGQSGNMKVLNLSGKDWGGRVLTLKFNEDGTTEVSGQGFSEDELNQIREQLKGQTGSLKFKLSGDAAETVLGNIAGGPAELTYILPGGPAGEPKAEAAAGN